MIIKAFICSHTLKVSLSVLLNVVLIQVSLEIHYFLRREVILVTKSDQNLIIVGLGGNFFCHFCKHKGATHTQNTVLHHIFKVGQSAPP